MMACTPCSVIGCPCESWAGHEARASQVSWRIRSNCICQDAEHHKKCKDWEHCLLLFAHKFWNQNLSSLLPDVREDCKHKKGLHVAKASSGEVPWGSSEMWELGLGWQLAEHESLWLRIPAYWTNQDGEFNELVPLTGMCPTLVAVPTRFCQGARMAEPWVLQAPVWRKSFNNFLTRPTGLKPRRSLVMFNKLLLL